jgi:glycosyltransferase involved in cell wall biosynthesis
VLANYLNEDNPFVHLAARRADKCLAASRMLIQKAKKKYSLREDPQFMPTPVEIGHNISKSDTPLFIFVARLDRRKRPEIFFELAREFPNFKFLAAGNSRDPRYETYLRDKYQNLPNLDILGFIDQFERVGIRPYLNQSWILVNTSARESLPNTFIEAASNQCALLSNSNPDDFVSSFGYHVKDEDFAKGVRKLLQNDLWREKGLKGYQHVREVFELNHAIDGHIEIYKNL